MDQFEQVYNKFMALPLLARIGSVAGAGVLYFLTKYSWWRLNEKSKPFNAYTTNREALNGIDLTGKVAVITGANNGIGFVTAREMARQGCHIIMACRSMDKGEKARQNILESVATRNDQQIIVMPLDLSSFASVTKFGKDFNSKNMKIDYLINNAGIMALPDYRTSKDGFEMQFATNHLGHFLLTHLLMPSLLKKDSSTQSDRLPRVINLSSTAHRYTASYSQLLEIFERCKETRTFMGDYEKNYSAWFNYGISKTSNISFSRELQKRMKGELIAVSLHPGGVNTGLGQYLGLKDVLMFLRMLILNPSFYYKNMKSLEVHGAACSLRCVSIPDDEISKGSYYMNCDEGDDKLVGAAAENDGGKLDAALWELSQILIEEKGYSLTP